MNNRVIRSQKLRVVYSILAIVASLAATQALLWPRWPKARPLDQEAVTTILNDAGLKATPLKPLTAKRNFELATSSAIGYSLDSGWELRMMRGVARKRFNFQLAFLTTLHPELQLKERDVFAGPPPYASGLVEKKPAFQTCLVHGNHANRSFGVTRDDLSVLVDKASQSKWSSLRSIIGLQANRNYECILIQARKTSGSSTSVDQRTWTGIISALQSAPQPDSSKQAIP